MSDDSVMTTPSRPARPRVFVRQPLTRAGNNDAQLVQAVLDQLVAADVEVLTGVTAQTAESFRSAFEAATGARFSPSAFRSWRLSLLAQAHAMVIVRTEVSESGAFEIAYNCVVTRRPMFFAVHVGMPIITSLLQDLDPLCPTIYAAFDRPSELAEPLDRFLARIRVPGNQETATALTTVPHCRERPGTTAPSAARHESSLAGAAPASAGAARRDPQ